MRHILGALRAAVLAGAALLGTVAPAENGAPPHELRLYTRFPSDVMALVHGSLFGPDISVPRDVAPFSEPSLTGSVALNHRIRDAAGNAIGFATQLEAMEPAGPHTPPPRWPTWWTVILPGRGAIFLHEIEDTKKLLGEMRAAVAAPQPWHGNIEERTTAGPLANGLGQIVGGTGEFAGRSGMFVEINRYTGTDKSSPGGMSGEIELRIDFDGK